MTHWDHLLCGALLAELMPPRARKTARASGIAERASRVSEDELSADEGAAPAPSPALVFAESRTESLNETELQAGREALAAVQDKAEELGLTDQIGVLQNLGRRAEEVSSELNEFRLGNVQSANVARITVPSAVTTTRGSAEREGESREYSTPPTSGSEPEGDRPPQTGRGRVEPASRDAAGPGRGRRGGVAVGAQSRRTAQEKRRADRARQEELEEGEAFEEQEEHRTREAAAKARGGAGRRQDQFADVGEDWYDPDDTLFADADAPADEFVESGISYDSRFKRPERLLYGRGPVEAVNLCHRGELEKLILGFKDLSVAAQYETEYLFVLVGRCFDVSKHLSQLHAAYLRGVDVNEAIADATFEMEQMFELGNERLSGNVDRARTATGHHSRGWSVDVALKLMLDLRDDRLDRGEFVGTFGKAKRNMRNLVRTKEITQQANKLVYGDKSYGRGGGGVQQRQTQYPQPAPAPAAGAPAPAPPGKGGDKGKGRGRARGRGRGA